MRVRRRVEREESQAHGYLTWFRSHYPIRLLGLTGLRFVFHTIERDRRRSTLEAMGLRVAFPLPHEEVACAREAKARWEAEGLSHRSMVKLLEGK